MSLKDNINTIEMLCAKKTKDKEEFAQLKMDIEDVSFALSYTGHIDATREAYFDIKTCRYTTINRESNEVHRVTSSEKTFQKVASSFYKYQAISENYAKNVPAVTLVFNPHAGRKFTSVKIPHINTFTETDYLRLNPICKEKEIRWDDFPTIDFLFENVFHQYKNDFINWLAYACQYRKKSGIAWISKGEKGTGKGMIFEHVIKPLFRGYTNEIGDNELRSNFNTWQDEMLFVLADEVSIDYKDSLKTTGNIKKYIASPFGNTEGKGVDAIKKEYFYNMWFHSNNKNPFIVEDGDRRVTIVDTKGKLKEIDGFDVFATINSIKEEIHEFLLNVSMLEVDVDKACTPLHTAEKELSIVINQTSMEFIEKLVKDNKYDEIEEILAGSVDNINISDADVGTILSHLINGYLTTKDKTVLHYVVFGKKHSVRKVGVDFVSHFGKTKSETVSGKKQKVTIFKPMYPIVEE